MIVSPFSANQILDECLNNSRLWKMNLDNLDYRANQVFFICAVAMKRPRILVCMNTCTIQMSTNYPSVAAVVAVPTDENGQLPVEALEALLNVLAGDAKSC